MPITYKKITFVISLQFKKKKKYLKNKRIIIADVLI